LLDDEIVVEEDLEAPAENTLQEEDDLADSDTKETEFWKMKS